MVDYKYPVYRFSDHSIEELEQSNNPFAIAVIAENTQPSIKQM